MKQYIISAKSLFAEKTEDVANNIRLLDCSSRLQWTSTGTAKPISGRDLYAAKHIPDAIFVDLVRELSGEGTEHLYTLPDTEKLSSILGAKGIERSNDIIIYSQNSMTFAARAWWVLRYYGFENVKVLDGGLSAWEAAGFSVTTDIREYAPVKSVCQVQPAWLAEKARVEAAVTDDTLLLCAMSRECFSGTTENHFGKPGHIPNSFNTPYKAYLSVDGTLDLELFQAQLDMMNATEGQSIITYCANGIEASLLSLMLAELGRDASLYNGSMYEWSKDDTLNVTTGQTTLCEVAIIGGGPSGLSAALTLGRSRRNTVVFDSGTQRNKLADAAHNVLALDGVPPMEILARTKTQLARYDKVSILDHRVEEVTRLKGLYASRVGQNLFYAQKLILATGLLDVLPNIKGLQDLWATKLFLCPYCHGYEVKDQPLGLIVTKDTHVVFHSLLIQHWASDLVVFTNGAVAISSDDSAMLKQAGIRVVDTPIAAVENVDDVVTVHLSNGVMVKRHALFAHSSLVQQADFAKKLGCEIDEKGFVTVDPMKRTSVPGIFSCGDATTPFSSISFAMAAGTTAGTAVNMELVSHRVDFLKSVVKTESNTQRHGFFSKQGNAVTKANKHSHEASSTTTPSL